MFSKSSKNGAEISYRLPLKKDSYKNKLLGFLKDKTPRTLIHPRGFYFLQP
jgi:hypothetical protein